MELTILSAFLRIVLHGVVSRLAPDAMTRVCGEGGVLIRASQEMTRKFFEMGIFRVFRRMHCNPIFGLLAIAILAEGDWDFIGAECFSFDYKRSRFIFIPSVPGLVRKRADITEVAEDAHDGILPIYSEEFSDRGMSRIFTERAWELFLGKSD